MIKDKQKILYGIYALTFVFLIIGVIGIVLSYYNIQGLNRVSDIGLGNSNYSKLRSLMIISFGFALVALIACIIYLLVGLFKSHKKVCEILKLFLNIVIIAMFILLVIWMIKFHSNIPTYNSSSYYWSYSTLPFQYFKACQVELFMPIICLGVIIVINICDNIFGMLVAFKKKKDVAPKE